VGQWYKIIVLNKHQRLFLGRTSVYDRPQRLGSQRPHRGVVSIRDVTSYSVMRWPLGQQQFLMPLMLTVILSYLEFILWCTI